MKDVKERGRFLADEFGMDSHQSRKIWCFGPASSGPNMLIDVTKSCQYLHEVKDTVVAGFQWATEEVGIIPVLGGDDDKDFFTCKR